MLKVRLRNQDGQAMIALSLLIGFFVLLIVGLFGFEVNRAEVARQQLRTACEAAALAGAATLASQDSTDTVAAQTQALNTALNSFQKNEVAGSSLSNALITYTNPDFPSANNSSIYVEFLDPHNNNQPVSLGNPAGKIVRVTAAFGLQPAFGAMLGIGTTPIRAISSGGVPNLDVVLCFDVSGSIDDQTPVSFVRRQWDATTGKIKYTIPPTAAGSPAGPLAQGKIYDVLGPPATGSTVDGLYPQHLSGANQPGTNRYPLNFSEVSGRSGSAVGLRGNPNAGSPPGNCPPGAAGVGNAYTFTDLVVNIDGRNQFGGMTSGGYNFPDVATLVEAARGNLESQAVFTSSRASLSLPSSVTPMAGYQAEYLRQAALNVHPIRDAQMASQVFLTIMNTNTDAHFGLVCFTSNAGTSASTVYPDSKIDSTYGAGGSGNFPNPMIALNSSVSTTNYTTCYNVLPTTVALGGTNIGDAVNQAVNTLKTNSRPGSKKAIVVFTDGQPTSGGPLNGDPWTNSRMAAVNAKNSGIPIYTIGLAQNPAIIPGETAILNDTNASPSSGGIAAIAGNGGKFFLVTNVNDLRATFENIARQLVQLVK